MSKHLTFSEMADVAFMERLEDDIKALVLKVQSHVLECAECKETYNKLVSLHETTTRLAYDAAHTLRHKAVALKFINTLSENASFGRERVSNWMDKIISDISELSITAKTYMGKITELAAHSSGSFDFGYSIPVGARGVSDTQSNKTVLIDDHDADNRIFLDQHDGVVIRIRAENFSSSEPSILLVDNAGNAYISKLVLTGEVFVARFEGLCDGEYHIYFE